MEMQIKLLAKQQYGRWVYYPQCRRAKLFAKIAGTDTLTQPVLMHIKDLGFELVMEMAKPSPIFV